MQIKEEDLEILRKGLETIERVYKEKSHYLDEVETKEDAFREGINSAVQVLKLNQIYSFIYCPCIFESGFVTISLHRTKEGAYKAMRKHLVEAYNNWFNERLLFGVPKGSIDGKFGENERWGIKTERINE